MEIVLAFSFLFTLLLISLALFYFAYRLLWEGLMTDKGEFYNKFGEDYIVIKKAIPGIFFFCMASLIIYASVTKGFKQIDSLSTCQCCQSK